jgi:hypothetical protein
MDAVSIQLAGRDSLKIASPDGARLPQELMPVFFAGGSEEAYLDLFGDRGVD